MNISISPVGIGLVLIVVTNCLISFGKSDAAKKCYIVLSSILSVIGITGMIITRPLFIAGINKSANRRNFDPEFVSWGMAKFDAFAIISIIVTCLVIIFLLYLLLKNKKNKSGFVWDDLSVFVIVIMVINFFAGLWYSFGTLNKLFDIAFYIGALSISEIFALYIPLIAKRIIIRKD